MVGRICLTSAAFTASWFEATRNTVTSPDKLFAFLVRWWQQSHDKASGQSASAKPSLKKLLRGQLDKPVPTDPTRQLLSRYQSLDDLRKAGPLEKELADQITALVEKHKTASTKAEQLQTAADNAYASMARKITAKHPGTTQLFEKVKSAADRVNSITHTLKDVEGYIALLYSYMDLLSLWELLKRRAALAAGLVAWMLSAARATCSFPRARSPRRRPSAIRISGASRKSRSSITRLTRIQYSNETSARRWVSARPSTKPLALLRPASTSEIRTLLKNSLTRFRCRSGLRRFGAIDADKAAKGKVLYQQNCAACHEQFASSPPPDNMGQGSWVLNTYPIAADWHRSK